MLYLTPIKFIKAIAFGLLYLFFGFGYSQEVQLDPNFNSYDDGLLGDGFDGTVWTLSLQTDGKLIVGGEFLNYNGKQASYLCRLLTDGSRDIGFNLGTAFNGKIYTSVIQPDGKIIVAGAFTSYNGNAVGRIVRLNQDGSKDSTFDCATAANSGTIYGLALQPDGKVVVVGSFTKYNGTTVNRIARVLANGDLDNTFDTGTAATSGIEDVVLAAGGKIVVSGTFNSFNGNTKYAKIVRLNTDGSIDATLSTGTGFDDAIETIAVQADGKIIVGGSFLSYNGSPQARLVRLNTNGTVDATFSSGTGFSNGTVHTIKLTSSGIIVGGSFSNKYKTTAVNRLVLLNTNGSLDADFDIGAGPSSATVYCVTESSDSFFVGGSFSVFDELKQGKLTKISTNGALDAGYLTAGVGFDKAVDKVIALADGNYIAFGSFTQFNGKPSNRIAKLTANGELDPTFNLNQSGANGTIKDVVVQADGNLLVAGDFTLYNGFSAKRLVRLLPNGTIDNSFATGAGFNYMVYSIALQSDGKSIVAGSFTTYKGGAVKKVIRLHSNGDLDPSFTIGTGPDATPNLLLLQPDGKVVVSGDFTTFNGVVFNKLIRLNSNGSVDSSFSIGTGFVGSIYTITLQADQKILLGGSFSKYNGQALGKIIRLHPNGSPDTTFNFGSGFSGGIVRTIAVQDNGSVLVGGSFSGKYNGTEAKRMIRLLPDGAYDTSFPIVLNGQLNSIGLVPGGAVIGGQFNSVSGISKHRIAKLLFCPEATTWNGTHWTNGIPTIDKTAVFTANYDSEANLTACSCVVNSGVRVGIKNAATLELALNFSGGGKLIFENNASLFQADDRMKNTSVIDFKRQTTPVRKKDYTYWSSPVSAQQLKMLSPNSPSSSFYSFNNLVNNWQKEATTNTMVLGKGYIFQAPENFSETVPTIYEAVFSGIPNNGLITLPIAKTKAPILVGNPYPSALSADAFILENQTVLQGSLYFWTHTTPVANGSYTADDYAVYTLLGGVGTVAKNSGSSSTIPSGAIASGQAFFVLGANQQGSIVFKNAMRLKGQNHQFFKNPATTTEVRSKVEKHRIWLNLSNSQGLFKQLLLGYATGATQGKDLLFDGLSLDSNEWLDFYSLNNGEKNSIQARGLPFAISDSISLGYRVKQEGDYTISLDNCDGLFANQALYLEDKQTSAIQDLQQAAYSFSTTKGSFDDRLVLRFQNEKREPPAVKTEVQIVTRDHRIQVSASKDRIAQVTLHSLEGKLLYQSGPLESKTHTIEAALWKNNVLIIQITLETGEKSSRKLLF